jgi:formylglycine-generating enzyme
MRHAIAFSIAALLVAADTEARPPRHVRTPPEAPALPEAPSAAGLAVLRNPGPKEVLLRGGSFTMGSDVAEIAHAMAVCRHDMGEGEPDRVPANRCREQFFSDEFPPHEVYLADVWMDRTEVTVARFRQCVAAGRCNEPPFAAGGDRFDQPDVPVVLVTWSDAAAFCAWDGGRLPTEAEWERAARGLTGRRYPWGNAYNPSLANHGRLRLVVDLVDLLDESDGFLELAPVGSFPNGRTPEGLADLAGNAEEWVEDWYAPEYPEASQVNPHGPDTGEDRVTRGGSYLAGRPWMRAAARQHRRPGDRMPWVGFRCARGR